MASASAPASDNAERAKQTLSLVLQTDASFSKFRPPIEGPQTKTEESSQSTYLKFRQALLAKQQQAGQLELKVRRVYISPTNQAFINLVHSSTKSGCI